MYNSYHTWYVFIDELLYMLIILLENSIACIYGIVPKSSPFWKTVI